MYAKWEAALDAQLDAYLWTQTDRAAGYLGGWLHSATGKRPGNSDVVVQGIRALESMLFNAEPIWVEPEMMELWEAAYPDFQPEPLREDDILTQTGFVYLPRPFHMTDVHGTDVSHRAIAWRPADLTVVETVLGVDNETKGKGILLYLFHAVGDKDTFDAGDGFPPKWKYREHDPWVRGTLLLDHIMPWAYGRSYRLGAGPYVQSQSPIPVTNVMQPIQCLFRLMQQTIATKNPGRPAKPYRRRWAKAKMPERNVVIVRLRRPKNPPHEDSEVRHVDWQHRWVVSGHWRNQWYPAAGVHRQIWISPFIKGPEDRELLVRKTRIFDWSR